MSPPPQKIAEFINTFFTNNGPELARDHKMDWIYFGDTLRASINQLTTNAEEVRRLCAEIIPMKSSGMDEISQEFVRKLFLY